MAQLFSTQAFRKIFPPHAAKVLLPVAVSKMRFRFESAQALMEQEFDRHAVTKEIEDGPTAENYSNTLSGIDGNLFSFIGFVEGDNPTEIVRQALKELCSLNERPKTTISGNRIIFNFSVRVPTLQELEAFTPMPWEPGSWLTGIERGISGLGYYLFKLRGFPQSRSGTAVQIKRELRSGKFRNVSYVSEILQNFYKRL